MQEREQTLADISKGMAEVRRWVTTNEALDLVHTEREAQFAQWGEQDIPMGTSPDFTFVANYYRTICQRKTAAGDVTYADVLLEEVYEALAETDPLKLLDELVQVAAVAVQMIEHLRAKQVPTPEPTGQADSA